MSLLTQLCCSAVALAGPSLAFAQSPLDPASSIAAMQRPDGLAALDWNSDGAPDFAVTVDNQDRILFFQNVGGTWSVGQTLFLGSGVSASALASGDFDGDGDKDLAVALKDSASVRVARNDGAGVFTLMPGVSVGARPVHLVAGDWNGDGMVDLASANRDGNSVSVLLSTGGGNLASGATLAASTEPRAVAAGDWNGDGAMDLAVTCHDSRQVRIFSGNGAGGFTAGAVLSVGFQVRPEGIAAGDVDQDGDADLLVATSGNGFNFLTTFTNTGGVFGVAVNSPTGGVNPSCVAAADLDGDGMLDAVVTNQDSNTLAFLKGNGTATFGAPVNSVTGVRPGTVIAADLDGDGDRDVLTANRDGNNLSMFTNQSGPAGMVKYCEGGLNSVGTRASIDSTGSLSISANALNLRVLNAVPSQFGLFFYGNGRDTLPFGAGTLCVAGPHYRLRPPLQLSAVGSASKQLDFLADPLASGAGAITPGSTWNFQFWYRDPGGSAFNLSDGVELTLEP